MDVHVRAAVPADGPWVAEVLTAAWGGTRVARLGEVVDVAELPGYVAAATGERVGHVALAVRGPECEVVSLLATVRGRGVGRRSRSPGRAAFRYATSSSSNVRSDLR